MTDKFIPTVPPDSEKAGLGGQRIRELTAAVDAVLEIEHDVTDGAAMGFHDKVTLGILAPGAGVANKILLYAKDVDGKARLHAMDEDDGEWQITGFITEADPTERSSNSASWVNEANLSITIPIKIGELWEVYMIGEMKSVTGTGWARIHKSSGASTDAPLALSDSVITGSEYYQQIPVGNIAYQYMAFKSLVYGTADENVVYKLRWIVGNAGYTIYAQNRRFFAKRIG